KAAPLGAAVERAVADARAFVSSGNEAAMRGGDSATPAAHDPVVRLHPVPMAAATDAVATAAGVGEAGGRVVAAGGCFDVLHTGHVRLLEEARRLGDRLVVCLNDDGS